MILEDRLATVIQESKSKNKNEDYYWAFKSAVAFLAEHIDDEEVLEEAAVDALKANVISEFAISVEGKGEDLAWRNLDVKELSEKQKELLFHMILRLEDRTRENVEAVLGPRSIGDFEFSRVVINYR